MINLVASLMPIMLDVNFKSQSAKLRYLISLSGRGRLVRDFSLCLPIWVLILNLQRCSSGRGDNDFLLTASHSSRLSSCSVSLLHSWTWPTCSSSKSIIGPAHLHITDVEIHSQNCNALSGGSLQFKGNILSFCNPLPPVLIGDPPDVGWGALPCVQLKQERASQPLSRRHLSRGRLFMQSATTAGNVVVLAAILALTSAPLSSSNDTVLTQPCRTAISRGLIGSRLRLAPAFSNTSAVSVLSFAIAK